MKLDEAIAQDLARMNVKLHKGARARLLDIIERFLRHNGHEAAADALHTEHMP